MTTKKCCDKKFETSLEVKKSKFLSTLLPYEQFGNELAELKSLHPKAVHFVYAYRYLNEIGQIVENMSDDGEPRGSSGRPTLNVLIGHQMINSAIITVRYFGGTKLGVGGLVRAYSDSANLVLSEASPFITIFQVKIYMMFEVIYSELSRLEYHLKQSSWNLIHKEFLAESVKMSGTINKDEWEEKEKLFQELANCLSF